jgi:hypothetical protein
MQANTSEHMTGAGSQMKEWFTPETEKIVEQCWVIKWANEKVNFGTVTMIHLNVTMIHSATILKH